MARLKISALHKYYGKVHAVRGVDLDIPEGEFTVLVGPSGCGKSTLLRLAAGLETLQAGSIVINEQTVALADRQVPPERRRVGLMFQDYALFPHLSNLDNVAFGLSGMAAGRARARALEMLEQVGMADHAGDHPHTLSGGQQQRVALARALAPEPKLLLLDEPFSGLDSNMRARIREETLAVLKASGVATLMVTHDPEEAMFMADRIKILGPDGRILQAGRPHDIYYKPNDEFVARMFGFVNEFEGRIAGGEVTTPLGALPVPNLAEGTPVRVLIRPEGVRLFGGDGTNGVPVEVLSTHLIGYGSIVRVRLKGTADGNNVVHARVHRDFTPEFEHRIEVYIDPTHAFVFPLSGAGARDLSAEAQGGLAPSDVKAAE